MSFTRRKAFAIAATLAVVPAALVAAQSRPATHRRTFVLVHGGGHGGWCWKRVAEPLEAAGHRVFAPSLTGLADRSHLLSPNVDLDTHITDIVNLLSWEDLSDVILVGHSYGGMVMTGVADRAIRRIGHMVYLDAAHPKNGEPLFKMPAPSTAAPANGGGGAGGSGSAAGLPKVVNGVELTMFPNTALVNGALGVTDPKDVAWLMEKLTPQPLKSFTQPLRLENEAAVHALPTTDIWRSVVLANLRKSGGQFTHAQQIWEINSTSHDLMITEPQKTTEMLLRVAAL